MVVFGFGTGGPKTESRVSNCARYGGARSGAWRFPSSDMFFSFAAGSRTPTRGGSGSVTGA